ncbi:MAG: peptide ABC transporter ATP-binding protein, partial [Spirochaetaceae bacterium]|nr:peptide ABC transporter ATP-binding protein [Spirochaetaceae bacterium]
RVQREEGLAYLFISHNLDLVRHVSDRIHVMYLGRAVEEGGAEELFERPLHPYTEALLASVPGWDPTDRRMFGRVLSGEPPSPLWDPPGCPFEPRCPKACERCRAEAPALRELAPGRRVACHLA